MRFMSHIKQNLGHVKPLIYLYQFENYDGKKILIFPFIVFSLKIILTINYFLSNSNTV